MPRGASHNRAVRWNLALGGLAASWGFIAVLVASVDLGAEALAFWRLALAAGTLALVALCTRRLDSSRRGDGSVRWRSSASRRARTGCSSSRPSSTDRLLAVLTFYAAPLVIALVAPLVLPERLSPVVLGACLVGAVGIAAIALGHGGEDGSASAAALAAGLGSAVTYAALVILSKRLLEAATPPLTVAFWDCLVGAVVVAPVLPRRSRRSLGLGRVVRRARTRGRVHGCLDARLRDPAQAHHGAVGGRADVPRASLGCPPGLGDPRAAAERGDARGWGPRHRRGARCRPARTGGAEGRGAPAGVGSPLE